MKLFELFNNDITAHALIIGGHHGNEIIGVDICKRLSELTSANDGIKIVPIANHSAYSLKTREFNDIDMNRAYTDVPSGNKEIDDMVDHIKYHALNSTVVIDCHSTPIKDLNEISVYPNHVGESMAHLMELPFYRHPSPEGSLRYFCDQNDVAAITFEGVDELHDESVDMGVSGILKILNALKII